MQIIEKTENSFQEYDLLFYEINSIKQTLISQCRKINQKVLNNILKIKNPNDSIYFLMKIFFWIMNLLFPDIKYFKYISLNEKKLKALKKDKKRRMWNGIISKKILPINQLYLIYLLFQSQLLFI